LTNTVWQKFPSPGYRLNALGVPTHYRIESLSCLSTSQVMDGLLHGRFNRRIHWLCTTAWWRRRGGWRALFVLLLCSLWWYRGLLINVHKRFV